MSADGLRPDIPIVKILTNSPFISFGRGGERFPRFHVRAACNRIGTGVATDSISSQFDPVADAVEPGALSALGETLARCEQTGRSVFLFGGDATSIRMVRERVASDHPRLRIAGICDADFSGPAGAAILGHIASCKPDVLVVDLSPTRHRALVAEVAAAGLRFTVINRPSSFARYAGKRDGAAWLATAPRPFAKAAKRVVSAVRFAGIVFRQACRSAGGQAPAPGQAGPGRPG